MIYAPSPARTRTRARTHTYTRPRGKKTVIHLLTESFWLIQQDFLFVRLRSHDRAEADRSRVEKEEEAGRRAEM